MSITETIEAVQRALNLKVDGIAGPKTWTAIADEICGLNVAIVDPRSPTAVATATAQPGGSRVQLDARTEGNIATLLPKLQTLARVFVAAVNAQLPSGFTAKIISGTRSYVEQDALYAQGRTQPGRIVTNARGGYSNHNFGIAFDLGIFEGAGYLDQSPHYRFAGKIGKQLGLEWGGDWQSIQDEPHFGLKTGLTLAQMRQRKANGEVIA